MGLLIIPILAFLIVIHELGHFFAARSVGIKVEEFGVGIPPRVRGWRWKGVLWSLNAIPFGGFVRVKGEDANDREPGSMNVAGPLQRAWFLIAGPLMNLLAAVLLSIVIVGAQGKAVDLAPLYIGTVAPASPAEEAGWLPGDRIVAVEGVRIDDSNEVVSAINARTGEETDVTIQRGTETIETSLVPRKNPPSGEGATGIGINNGQLSKVTINDVDEGSIAAEAGLQENDRLIAINGVEVDAFAQAIGLLNSSQGEEATLTVLRDGAEHDLTFQVPITSILIQNVEGGSAASDARLYEGDHITHVNDELVTSAPEFVAAMRENAGKDAELTVMREERELTTTISLPETPENLTNYHPVAATGMLAAPVPAFTASGISILGTAIFEDVPASNVVQEGWNEFWFLITGTIDMLQTMMTEGVDTDQLIGPIGMGQLAGELFTESPEPLWITLTQYTILISVSLGILNLLPIPALDGGRLIFVFIEILRGGKRIPPEKEGLVHLAGMMLLLGLMFFVAFGDISRIIDGDSILP